MSVIRVGLSFVFVVVTAGTTLAQNAVQLPTLSSFRTATTISVPDRGSVYTGGVNRAADGRNEFGAPLLPFGNRSIGSTRSASSVWTSVYIHDFQAMDEALLSQARGSSYPPSSGPALADVPTARGTSQVAADRTSLRTAPWQVGAIPRPTTGPLSKSVAQLRAERAGEQQARVAEAKNLFERGKAAAANGKLNVARIYYQQASRRAQGPLRDEILAQLQLVTTPSVAQR